MVAHFKHNYLASQMSTVLVVIPQYSVLESSSTRYQGLVLRSQYQITTSTATWYQVQCSNTGTVIISS
jgi:hypothetical protein